MNKITSYFIILCFTLGCFWIHFNAGTNSMLNDNNYSVSNEYLVSVVAYHKSHPEFQKRPLTTFMIEQLVKYTAYNIGEAFILINFIWLFLSGIMLHRLSYLLVPDNKKALLNTLIYLACFSNLFAFFPPIYTYDEPIQYFLILLSLYFVHGKIWWAYLLCFSLSLIARESGMILLPGLVLLLWYREGVLPFKNKANKKLLFQTAILLLPAFIYLSFINFYLEHHQINYDSNSGFASRLSLFSFNTQNTQHTIESIVSFFLVLGVPLYLFFNGIRKRFKQRKKYKAYTTAFFMTVLINSGIVLFLTQAREVRLFAIPLFFIWPIFSTLFKDDIKLLATLEHYKTTFRKSRYIAYFVIMMAFNYFISFRYYKTTIGSPNDNYFNEYLFVMISVLLLHATLKLHLKASTSTSQIEVKV